MAGKPEKLGPAFVNVVTANLASSLGDGIARIAMPLLVARLTDDPLLISMLGALVLLPWLLFAIPAGILVDRVDRRMAMAVAQAFRMLLAAALVVLVITDTITIWWVLAAAFLYGAMETIYDSAIRAVLPSIVRKSQLPRANSVIEGGELVVQSFLSAPLTSVLFVIAVAIPFGINGVVFALAAGLALALPKAASGRQFAGTGNQPEAPWHRQFLDGVRFIRSNRMLSILWLFSTLVGLLCAAATSSLVLFVLGPLQVPEAWFGVFLLSGAAGGILGSVITSRLKTWLGAGTAMAIASVLTGAAFLFMGLVPQTWAGALGFGLSSLAITVWNVLVMSLRQAVIPGRLLGRVHGTWRTLLWGTMPVGSLLGGLIGRIDLSLPFIIGGGAVAVLSLIMFRFLASLPNPEDVDNGDPEAGPTEAHLVR